MFRKCHLIVEGDKGAASNNIGGGRAPSPPTRTVTEHASPSILSLYTFKLISYQELLSVTGDNNNSYLFPLSIIN